EGASRSLRRALKLSDGRSVPAALGLARIEIVLEDYEEAMEHVRTALEVAVEPEDQATAQFLYGQAAFLRHAGTIMEEEAEEEQPDLRPAETALRRAIQLGPPVRHQATILLAEVLLLEGRRADARRVIGLLEGVDLSEDSKDRGEAIRCELDLLGYDGFPEANYQPPVPEESDRRSMKLSNEPPPPREGTAIIAFVVDTEGTVRCARALRSFSPRGAQRWLSELEKMAFKPATLDGNPIPARNTQTTVVRFLSSSFSFAVPLDLL
ncbi:MAG: tetratricopeptide repeat protein, partial [Acidobacteria bacterium]|nr:tetratricopeptide repeat protein [Acidobacteriota bacterium]